MAEKSLTRLGTDRKRRLAGWILCLIPWQPAQWLATRSAWGFAVLMWLAITAGYVTLDDILERAAVLLAEEVA